jgi:hypothetical protein
MIPQYWSRWSPPIWWCRIRPIGLLISLRSRGAIDLFDGMHDMLWRVKTCQLPGGLANRTGVPRPDVVQDGHRASAFFHLGYSFTCRYSPISLTRYTYIGEGGDLCTYPFVFLMQQSISWLLLCLPDDDGWGRGSAPLPWEFAAPIAAMVLSHFLWPSEFPFFPVMLVGSVAAPPL